MPQNSEPYVGPRPFEEEDRRFFFGRDQEANELVALITAHPIVLLYAQSGAGKTSLVKASLVPLLVNQEKFDALPPMRVREQAATCAAPEQIRNIYMFNALMSATRSKEDHAGTNDDVIRLAGMSLSEFLKERRPAAGDPASFQPTVIIFDQFEELFTLYPERWEERQRFFEQIRDALADDSLLRVLFSMREDFIAELDPYAFCLPEKLRTRYRIERLNKRKALVAITRPLEAIDSANGKREFAPGAADELINNLLMMEVKTPQGTRKVLGKFVEALQLQVVCQTLWNSLKPEDKLITRNHLQTFGDVDRALIAFYENAIDRTGQRTGVRSGALRRWCERALITPAGTRAPVFRDEKETHGLSNEAVDELERQSLLRMELRGGARWYELTHDRFVEIIKQSNQKWLLTLPGAKQILLALEKRAETWDEKNRNADDLLNEDELFETDRWLASPEATELELGAKLDAFLRESRHAIEAKQKIEVEERRRIEEEARTARRFRWLSISLAFVLLLAVVASAVAFIQWRRARTSLLETERTRDTIKKAYDDLTKAKEENAAANETILNKERLNQAMRNGESLLHAGKYQEAEAEFNNLLKGFLEKHEDSDGANTYLELAEISELQNQYAKAIGHYEAALKLWRKNPEDPDSKSSIRATGIKEAAVYRDWGDQEMKVGEQEEAQGHDDKALRLYQSASGRYQRALKLLRKSDPGFSDASERLTSANEHRDAVKKKLQTLSPQ